MLRGRGCEGDQLLHRDDLGHRRAETVVDDRADIEPARLIKQQDALGNVAGLVEGKAAPADFGQAVADQAGRNRAAARRGLCAR